jgi:hypothetical protein
MSSPATTSSPSATAAPARRTPVWRSASRPVARLPVSFFTAAGLVDQLIEARDEWRLLKLQAQLAAVKLLIIDELGYVPLPQTGAELLFEIFSQRHERGSTIVTSNLPFEEWTSVFQSQRLTGALLDRLIHHVHILERSVENGRGGLGPIPVSRPRSSTGRADFRHPALRLTHCKAVYRDP